jgi:transcriptional regulator with XRE-family HTH domain
MGRTSIRKSISTGFGAFVRACREEARISQAKLARLMGVSRQFLNAIECSNKSVSLDMARNIAAAMKKDPKGFFVALFNDMLRKAGVTGTVDITPQDGHTHPPHDHT